MKAKYSLKFIYKNTFNQLQKQAIAEFALSCLESPNFLLPSKENKELAELIKLPTGDEYIKKFLRENFTCVDFEEVTEEAVMEFIKDNWGRGFELTELPKKSGMYLVMDLDVNVGDSIKARRQSGMCLTMIRID